ncbi:MAG: cytochrome c [Hyphomicrobiales bacterium]|nr:cytochrome c [Alphaproteobacteria bacterium]
MRAAANAFCAVAILAAGCLTSAAHDHATGVVKERMEMMEAMAKRLKAIRERVDAKRDLTAIKADAEAIASHAPHIVHLFPPGSTQKPTDARGTIWQNWADFQRKTTALKDASNKLANVSVDDLEGFRDAAGAVSQACGECHEKYRIKRRKGDL